MVRRFAFALFALLLVSQFADSGPFRNRRAVRYQPIQWQPMEVAAAAVTSVTVDTGNEEAQDALDEVNAERARSGLRPFIRDDGLVRAALACVKWRAVRRMHGHTGNDFMFVPDGSSATAAGAEGSYGWFVGGGWGTCCTFDNYTYAGAAFVNGSDGMRYMHLFVR